MSFYNSDYSNKTLDGTCQHLSMYTNKCYGEYAPFGEYDYTNLKITNAHHDVNLINQNFINVTAKFNVYPIADIIYRTDNFKDGVTVAEANADAPDYNNTHIPGAGAMLLTNQDKKKVYIGWKNSGEIIQEMTVYNNDRETGYTQMYADRENYLESTRYMTASDKDLKRDCHFTYYNYKEGYEHDVPGKLITDITNGILTPVDTTTANYEMPYQLTDHHIRPISVEFKRMHWAAAAIGGIADYSDQDLGDATFQEILHRKIRGDAHYVEFVDFAFNYDFANDGNYHTKAPAGGVVGNYASLQLLYAAIRGGRTPIVNDDTLPKESFTFISTRRYTWTEATPYVAEIPLIIPLKDLPAFNSMDFFESLFGDITLRMMFGTRALMLFTSTNKCQQLSGSGFHISNFTITNLTCECYGYNLNKEGVDNTDEAWAPLRSKYGPDSDRSRIYEARYTVFKSFESSMEGGRFHIEFPSALEMVKNIHMVFPRNTTQTTVFRNPFLKDVKLKLDGVLYPREEIIRTDNNLFYHLMTTNFEYDDDVRYSYQCQALNNAGNAPRPDTEKKEELDDSNFIMTYDLSVGHFMAMHRYNDNVNINFTAEIINFVENMYGVGAGPAYSDTEPAPQIWFSHDACWKLNLRDGLTFMSKTCPSYDLYNNDGKDIFYMK